MTDSMTFDEFKADWLKRHRSSIPRKPKVSSFGLIGGIALWVFIMVCAAIFSGAHTIPAAILTFSHLIPSPLRETLALSIFAVLELTIFAGSLYRRMSRIAYVIMIMAFVGALASNIGSSITAVLENGGDWLILIAGITTAVLAPSVALAAGEMSHRLYEKHQAAIEKSLEAYDAKMRDLDATINREHTKYVKAQTDTRQTPDRQSAVSAPVLSVQTDSRQTRQTGYGYSRTSDGQQKVMAYFDAHPDEITLALRTLAESIGVNKDTVNAGRKAWQERAAARGQLSEAERVFDVSTNGHGELES